LEHEPGLFLVLEDQAADLEVQLLVAPQTIDLPQRLVLPSRLLGRVSALIAAVGYVIRLE